MSHRTCSSHRSIFSRESILPPSDSATYRPIREEHIDSIYRTRTIFSSPFWKSAESTRQAAKKDFSLVLFYGHSTWKIFTEDNAATRYTHNKNRPYGLSHELPATGNTFYKLENQHTIRRHQKEPFLTLTQVYFCYKNKPFVVMFQRSFVIYFILLIVIWKLTINTKHTMACLI